MMESKVWFALCALLLMNMGRAEQYSTASTSEAPVTSKADTHVSASSMDPTSHPASALNASDEKPSSSGNSNLTSNMTGGTSSLTPEEKNKNDTNLSPPVAHNNNSLTENSTAQSPVPSLENNITTSNTPPTASTTHLADNTSKDTSNTTISYKPTQHETQSSTSAPTTEPPTPNTNTSNTTSTQSSSPPSTRSSQEPSNTEMKTFTLPHTSQTEITQGQPQSAISPSAQAKAHVDNPTKLNVEGETTMAHESPTLDPLLAGLVSAFIITAVIISLLLFLKLRRRNNRPQFRRLQDLPMDDMMEDTPLSMYTY
ncbi:hypothetical protein EXN66_Car006801 [Channa argus]|uniref:Uncharacterized protein n=1 Tax=Channa argus TaxID=215402 RepID=A0A6G1PLL8_CHAAH|nr:hypothetical protein EXN66_Car006801 [Channa argus]